MTTIHYHVLRYFYLTPPINERRLRRELRRLKIGASAARFARSLSLKT